MAPGQAGTVREARARPGHRRVAQWTRDYVRLPGIPDEYIAQDGAPREVWTRFFDAFAALTPADIERRFGCGRPASARSRRHLSRARRDRRPAVVAQPSAAADRRGRMAAIMRRHRAARAIARTGAGRSLRRGTPDRRRRDPGGGDRRQSPNICARSAASSRRAAATSISMARMSAADPTDAGGCWATAPRRPQARAMRWKIGWCCRAPSPRSTSR